VVHLRPLAHTLRGLAAGGADWFYRGEFAERMVAAVQDAGGLLSREDLAEHRSSWVEPISTEYRGYRVVELPPNGQGIAALLGLNILENFDLPAYGLDAADTHHYRIEATKLALADRNRYVADPEHAAVPTEALLSKDYALGRAALLSAHRALHDVRPGRALGGRDTVYLTAADSHGTLVSIINSLFFPFGSGVPVPHSGVILHNRGAGFVLDPRHPNCIAPGKRPLHTLIPAMLFRDQKPLVSFGVMGGDHQAQAHIQVVSDLVDFGLNVQEALDLPRFHWLEKNRVAVEEDFPAEVAQALRDRGHWLADPHEVYARGGFGGGQAIAVHPLSGVFWGGSDRRKDGVAAGF
jgi:gamma-glutamyltranspeptidase/glutathione hydrolase